MLVAQPEVFADFTLFPFPLRQATADPRRQCGSTCTRSERRSSLGNGLPGLGAQERADAAISWSSSIRALRGSCASRSSPWKATVSRRSSHRCLRRSVDVKGAVSATHAPNSLCETDAAQCAARYRRRQGRR